MDNDEPLQDGVIYLTPSWQAIGSIFYRLAVSNEVRALESGKGEWDRAFGMAEALSKLWGELTDEQRAKALTIIDKGMTS
jgi:hypothetical protein